MSKSLVDEARIATETLAERVVRQVWRHRSTEVGIEFTDGTRLFVTSSEEALELSITEGKEG